MKAQDLKNSILQMAMEGKLVPQDPNDEPASVLLERIKEEKEQLIKEKKIKKNNKESVIFRKDNHFYEKVGKKGEEVCIDDEIPFDIPNSWEWVKLENIVKISTGNKDANHGTEDGKYTFFTCSKDQIKSPTYSFEGECLLLPGNGANVGLVLYYDGKFEVYQRTYVLEKIYSNFNMKFLKIAMDWNWKKYNSDKMFGSAIPYIKLGNLKEYMLPMPPLNEQERIVNIFNEILNRINIYQEYEEQLNKLNNEFPKIIKDSILQYAIQGKLVPQNSNDEPANVLLDRIKEEKEQLIKEKKIKRNKNESFIFKENNHFYEKIGKNETICIDEEIPFEIPETWIWSRLGDLVYNFGQKKPDKTFSYVDVGSIDNKNLKLNVEENILTKEEAPSRARKIIKEGAVIYSTVRPYLLNMCIIDKDFSHEPIASTAFAVLNPFEGLYNKYLFYYLQSPTFINYVNSVMSGVAYPAINDKKLYNSLIAVPPEDEQKRIVEKLDESLLNINF